MTHPASRLCGLTPPYLHAASAMGDVPLVQYLIASGVALELRDGLGRSALHVALDHKQFECGALLLRAGASREAMDANGKTVATRVLELLRQQPDSPFRLPSIPEPEVRMVRTGGTSMLTLQWRKKKPAESPASTPTAEEVPKPTGYVLEWVDVDNVGAFYEDALSLEDALDACDEEEVGHG